MTDRAAGGLLDPIPVAHLGTQSIKVSIDASTEARALLADRFGLVELKSFTATATVRRRRDTGWIEVKGTLQARVVQECVVTLDPIDAKITAEIDELFDDSRPADGVEVDLDPVADDPEPLEGDVLDIGDVIAQVLSLSIDPYPRSSDAAKGRAAGDPAGDAAVDGQSPFAALALLKDRSVKKR